MNGFNTFGWKIILLILFWLSYFALIRWAYVGKHHIFHHAKNKKNSIL